VCLPAAAARKGVRGPETTAIAGRSAELDLGGPKALAAELADRGIRVNAVAPGATNTLFTGTSFAEPEVFATFVDRLLIKRVGEPEDMARPCRSYCPTTRRTSPGSSFRSTAAGSCAERPASGGRSRDADVWW
jgi:Enoyl-(Acyl carrier protein) reductase